MGRDRIMIGKQMAHAKRILATLEDFGVEAIIAGGAPRDWLLGRPASDLDVYISVNPNPARPLARVYFEDMGFTQVEGLSTRTPDHSDAADIESYSCMEHLVAVYNSRFIGDNNLNVQLIQVDCNDLIDMVMGQFPDICQAWLPTQYSPLYNSPDFIEAHNTQTCEYRDDNQHIRKMQLKFPNYTFTHRPVMREPSTFSTGNIPPHILDFNIEANSAMISDIWTRSSPTPTLRTARVSSIQPDFF